MARWRLTKTVVVEGGVESICWYTCQLITPQLLSLVDRHSLSLLFVKLFPTNARHRCIATIYFHSLIWGDIISWWSQQIPPSSVSAQLHGGIYCIGMFFLFPPRLWGWGGGGWGGNGMNSAYRVTNSLGVRFGIFSVYAEFPFRHCISIFYSLLDHLHFAMWIDRWRMMWIRNRSLAARSHPFDYIYHVDLVPRSRIILLLLVSPMRSSESVTMTLNKIYSLHVDIIEFYEVIPEEVLRVSITHCSGS